MHLPIAARPGANFLEGDFAGCVYRLPDRSIHVVVIEWRCCKTLVIDTGSSVRTVILLMPVWALMHVYRQRQEFPHEQMQ